MLTGYKTYIGLAAAALALLAKTVGAEVPEDLPAWLTNLIGFGGVVLGFIGKVHKDMRAPDPPKP